MAHTIIIGNGISGITAARQLRKLSDQQITVISSESDYFYSRTALMYIYMGHMRLEDTQPYENWFWKKNNITLIRDYISSIDFQKKSLFGISGKTYNYDNLILSTGSIPNKFGWPGQDLPGVSGMYSLQDIEEIEKYSKNLTKAVIVGGGLIGIELAEMLHSRHIPTTFLVREKSYWDNVLPPEESAMINRQIISRGIDLRLESELKSIHPNSEGKVGHIITNDNEKIECGFVGLTAGVKPNVDFLRKTDLNIDRGIIIDNHLKTNKKNVYAIGDCAQISNPKPGRLSIEAVWYTGRIMGEVVAYNIVNRLIEYNPGLWFNSAKFIDIEYQIYGDIKARLPENQQTFYWEHPDGEKSIRINYRIDNDAVVGFNLMGIRFRHEICEKWIKNQTPIETVMQQLTLANFDPELYKKYDTLIVNHFNQTTGSNIQLKSKRSLSDVLNFLKA